MTRLIARLAVAWDGSFPLLHPVNPEDVKIQHQR